MHLPMKLTLFVALSSLMLSSSIQEFILFAVSAILCCHIGESTVLFCPKTVMRYLAEVRI